MNEMSSSQSSSNYIRFEILYVVKMVMALPITKMTNVRDLVLSVLFELMGLDPKLHLTIF